MKSSFVFQGETIFGAERERLDSGIQLLEEGKLEEARTVITEVLLHAPTSQMAHFFAGKLEVASKVSLS
jgi:Tfp pilus assembly protein PilF